MRTTFVTVAGALALSLLAGCTEKVEPPSLAGPSTLARAITMTANKDTLFQNGVDFVDITVTSASPTGQPQAIPLRAEIMVGGVVQDFGTLSTKTPVTPATIRYTAPNASPNAGGQVAQEVTIVVTPTDSGDFRAEVARQVSLRLVPQGVILPTNPNLTAAFDAPSSTTAFTPATFDASKSTNGGKACLNECSYAWNFGDGTSGSGITTTHDYRQVGNLLVTLTVTDPRGAQATVAKQITVTAPPVPTTVEFTFSPTPAVVDQMIFFNAAASRAAPGRTLVSYDWDFGKGTTGSGLTVSKSYATEGIYTVTLKVTDDIGAFNTTSKPVTVTNPQPKPDFTITPLSPANNEQVIVNASSTTGPSPIVSYRWDFGTNSNPSTGSGISSGTTYNISASLLPATRVITLTVTDSAGRTATASKQVVVK